ncbi:MAG: shikimate dehydrogenase [Candidatus Omnitrophica bacterium]|nr:shikimate dehydrogenase [Candidatus Omnitrophota bacterium]
MKIYGLLGNKIGYSLSPAMHEAAFQKFGMRAAYMLFDIDPANVDDFLNGLLRSDIDGLNITVPYKIKAFEFIKKYGILDTGCLKIGSINTININNKSLFGYNTDTTGFIRSLELDAGYDPAGKKVFIFGAGGAGGAIAMELAASSETIFMSDVDAERVKVFGEHFLRFYGREKFVHVAQNNEDIDRALQQSSLVVNATPFGRNKGEVLFNPDFLHSNMCIYDLIYKPSPTPIVEEALKRSIKATNGLGMLLYQGAEAFSLWTGRKAPVETMRKALMKALKTGVTA